MGDLELQAVADSDAHALRKRHGRPLPTVGEDPHRSELLITRTDVQVGSGLADVPASGLIAFGKFPLYLSPPQDCLC
jgi:hypothetical protein